MPRNSAVANKILEPITFNWKAPDYAEVFRARMETLKGLREHPERIPQLKAYYADGNYADFINDWGITYDPRNAERKLPTIVPFILFPKQREWIDYVIRKWKSQEPGLIEKSRDMGVTWLAVSLACTLGLFEDGLTIGFGSRKSEYVDKIGTYKPILPKGRMFMQYLPAELRGGFEPWRDAPYMRISFPETGSIITGESGDDIGRGDRASIYFVDEAAHLERPELVDAALSQTTNCRIDMSSVRGMANPFAAKRWGGLIEPFIFDWRDDPRKDDQWYANLTLKQGLDPIVIAQEVDRDYSASVRGIVIPGTWVRAAIDARKKLGIAPAGIRGLAFDVADEGDDKNAICETQGIEILFTEEWSGKGSDTFTSTEYVFSYCEENGIWEFDYDADGLGAGVRGDARVINERRVANKARMIRAIGYRGSEAVVDPDGIVEGTLGGEGDAGRTNGDYFANHKAQSWWSLRRRFQKTYRWVVEGLPCPVDQIISISTEDPEYMKLVAELSQPTYKTNELGKIVINKKPDAMKKSPNRADAVVMRYAPKAPGSVEVSHAALVALSKMPKRRRAG